MAKKIIGLAVCFCFPALALAAYSTNYHIFDDSINFIGGTSSSVSYQIHSSGGVAAGRSNSSNYRIDAGVQMMTADPLSVYFSQGGNFSSLTTSNRQVDQTATWVFTGPSSGWELFVSARTSPALRRVVQDGFEDIFDYDGIDYNWTVGPNQSGFGFSPGLKGVAAFKSSDGATCGQVSAEHPTLIPVSGHCWDGFSTTPTLVASYPFVVGLEEMSAELKIRAEIGENVNLGTGSFGRGSNSAFFRATIDSSAVAI